MPVELLAGVGPAPAAYETAALPMSYSSTFWTRKRPPLAQQPAGVAAKTVSLLVIGLGAAGSSPATPSGTAAEMLFNMIEEDRHLLDAISTLPL